MNHDPFGLGELLYGMKPSWDSLTASLFTVGPLDEREWALAHQDCSLSTFCRNPLHPGPCAGWKKKLGVDAPGALKAIESARHEKVAARRVARAEAHSAAEKQLGGMQQHSPLRAKKAKHYHANVILGDAETKAAGKADKVILNKQEIKKYSKIKSAQMQGILTKHGLADDTGLEDRLAEAFARDNKNGNDEAFRGVIESSAASLAAKLAVDHCHKGNHKECDDATIAALREEFTAGAAHALLTGNQDQLDKDIADWDAGKLKLASKAEPKKAAPATPEPAKAPEPAKPTAPESKKAAATPAQQEHVHDGFGPDLKDALAGPLDNEGSTYIANKITQAEWDSLTPEEKAKLSAAIDKALNNGHPEADLAHARLADLGAKAAAPKKVAAPAKGPTDQQLVNVVKMHGSVKGAGKIAADALKAKGLDLDGNPKPTPDQAAANALTAVNDLFKGDSLHHVQQYPKIGALYGLSKADYDAMPAGKQREIADFLKHQHGQYVDGSETQKEIEDIQNKLGTTKLSAPVAPKMASGPPEPLDPSWAADPKKAVAAVNGMSQAQYDKLSPTEKSVAALLVHEAVQQGAPGADAAKIKIVKLAKPSDEGGYNVQQLDALNVAVGNNGTLDDADAMNIYKGLSADDFGKMDAADQQKILDDLQAMQNLIGGSVGIAAEKLVEKWKAAPLAPPGPSAAPSVPAPVSVLHLNKEQLIAHGLANGLKSATATKKLEAYEKITGDEFKQLDPNTQQLLLADLLSAKAKFAAMSKKKQAQDLHNYLSPFAGGGAGTGGAPNPGTAVVEPLTAEEKLKNGADAVGGIVQLFAIPGSPASKGDTAGFKAIFEEMAAKQGQDHAATMLSGVYAQAGMKQLVDIHANTGSPLPGSLVAMAKTGLAADIAKKLSGDPGPTPVLDSFKQAMKLGDPKDATDFLDKAIHTGGLPTLTPTSTANLAPSATHFGKFVPADPYVSSTVSTSPAADGVLFSAFKSAHKGSVLSHSNEEVYNNLLAVASHYAGKSPTTGDPGYSMQEYPSDLSVLQVAKAVDAKIAQAKGIENQNVLQKKMDDWSKTPAGQQYIAEHTTAGQKWTDNLSGAGAGHVEAAKAGLTIGDPVGQRAQKLTPSKNGKAPKYDATKTAADFHPITANEIIDSQTSHMAAAGTSWSPGQAESLANYTTGAYYELNGYLRGEDISGNKIDTISSLGLERIALIQNGMRPLQQDTQLKRGTGWEFVPPEFRDPIAVQKLIGKTVQDKAFMSTTVGGEHGEFTDAVQLIIEAPKGSPAAFVKQISHNAGENEAVLPAGTRFRILEVTPGNKVGKYEGSKPTVIRVRVVG